MAEATCATPGQTANVCTVCGVKENVVTIPQTGHYANGGIEVFAIQDAETGQWAEMSFECTSEYGYIQDLKWVSFCKDCKERENVWYCDATHTHDLAEEETSNNVYHCANVDEYIHYYKEVRNEDGTLIDTLWIGTHQCLTCDYTFTSTLLSEHAVRRVDNSDTWVCDTCDKQVTVQEAPEEFRIDWCEVCGGHSFGEWEVTVEENLAEALHREEERHCMLEGCDGYDPRVIHVPEEYWVLTEKVDNEWRPADYSCYDDPEELPEDAFVGRFCTICQMNQELVWVGQLIPVEQCKVESIEPVMDSPVEGTTRTAIHVCEPELTHLYFDLEGENGSTTLTVAGRKCLTCSRLYAAEKHVMTPVDDDRMIWHCTTCDKDVEAQNDSSVDVYQGWCDLYGHTYGESIHYYKTVTVDGEAVTLGVMRRVCTTIPWHTEDTEHHLRPSETIPDMYYCTECATDVVAIEGSDSRVDWCGMFGHVPDEILHDSNTAFYCDGICWAVSCQMCGKTLEVKVTAENIPEDCSDYTKESILVVEEHTIQWTYEYTEEDSGEYTIVELTVGGDMVFAANELDGTLIKDCTREEGRGPIGGPCLYVERYGGYSSTSNKPVSDFFVYREDMGGYVFVGSTE